jgi:L-ascorbate metabolism protein UlaG (beta-lactamase superfamily)
MRKIKRIMTILFYVFVLLVLVVTAFVNQKSFGKLPSGDRLKIIKNSPNYKDGHFQNEVPTTVMTGNKSGLKTMWEFLTEKRKDLAPAQSVPAVKTDLNSLPEDKDLIIWFGHSSYLLQVNGTKILVDPVLIQGSPVKFINKPYLGTDIYKPQDMPNVDFLIISHDHWDHLDYFTVKELKSKVKNIVVPLGVGENFEYWNFPLNKITELDWYKNAEINGIKFYCLPARHFSGRSLFRNKTLWASFVVEFSNGKTVYIGGDSGYGPHFKFIGKKFSNIDLAILENGQYNQDWNQIHTMPEELVIEMQELNAKKYVTVHHLKYTLSKHSWDEPLKVEQQSAKASNKELLVLTIGKPDEF